MIDPIATLIAAARGLGPEVQNVDVTIYTDGSASIRVITWTAVDVFTLARRLGCSLPELVSNARSEWLTAERGDWGQPLRITITGGYRDVCASCAATEAAR